MKQDLVAINKEKLNALILEIDSSSQNIKKILNNIAETYAKIEKETTYEGTQTYKAKEKVVYDMIDIIGDNLETYKEELMTVKKTFSNTSSKIADDFNRAAKTKYVGHEYRNKEV